MLNFIALVEDAVTQAKIAGYLSTSGLRLARRTTGYGRYVSVAGAGAWFGIDCERWAKANYPDTPIWLCLEGWSEYKSIAEIRHALRKMCKSDPPGVY